MLKQEAVSKHKIIYVLATFKLKTMVKMHAHIHVYVKFILVELCKSCGDQIFMIFVSFCIFTSGKAFKDIYILESLLSLVSCVCRSQTKLERIWNTQACYLSSLFECSFITNAKRWFFNLSLKTLLIPYFVN